MEKTGLELLREPFLPHQKSKLPKGTKAQNECPANEKKRCTICGGWHHPKIKHLDYVGHAALTDRLLDADPLWKWEPLAYDDKNLPLFDNSGGLWIQLTICGHTRIGYGHAEQSKFKEIGSREKEVIGDALRNAAMRFGAALDLWHKGDLHVDTQPEEAPKELLSKKGYADYVGIVDKLTTVDAVLKWMDNTRPEILKNLSKEDAIKLKSYCSQIVDVLTSAADKEKSKLTIEV